MELFFILTKLIREKGGKKMFMDSMVMKTKIVVLGYKHYKMDDKQGLSVYQLGSYNETNNECGLSCTVAQILNYDEIVYLKTIPLKAFPAVFSVTQEVVKIKDKNGGEKSGIAYKDLVYENSLNIVERKIDKKAV